MNTHLIRVFVGTALASLFWANASWAGGGPLDPTNAPGPTMYSLEEIYDVAWGLHERLATLIPQIQRTGQAASYGTGDDGNRQAGREWPAPRFTQGTGSESNCVRDNLTMLTWVRTPTTESYPWSDALAYCEALDGEAGRGGHTDWRMPNVNELRSLIDISQHAPALPAGHDFSQVQNTNYWTSSTVAYDANCAWLVDMNAGMLNTGFKTLSGTAYNWPVRGP